MFSCACVHLHVCAIVCAIVCAYICPHGRGNGRGLIECKALWIEEKPVKCN